MDIVNFTVAAQQIQTKQAIAAEVMKMNHESTQQMVAMLQQGSENLDKLTAITSSGMGKTVNISA